MGHESTNAADNINEIEGTQLRSLCHPNELFSFLLFARKKKSLLIIRYLMVFKIEYDIPINHFMYE